MSALVFLFFYRVGELFCGGSVIDAAILVFRLFLIKKVLLTKFYLFGLVVVCFWLLKNPNDENLLSEGLE